MLGSLTAINDTEEWTRDEWQSDNSELSMGRRRIELTL